MTTIIDITEKLKQVQDPNRTERDYKRICVEIDRIHTATQIKGLSPPLITYLDNLHKDQRFSYYDESEMSHLCMQVEVYAQRYTMGLVPYPIRD